MSKGLIITDTIDITVKDKSKFTFDSFYKTTDSKKGSSIINKDSSTKMYGPVYAILSTSAKDINSRNYSYDSLKQNVINHDWTNYSRPLLRHHNLEDGTSCGRIDKSFFYDHSTKEVTAEFSDSKLKKDVLDYFESKGAFDKGTASTIVELSVDEYTYERMKNGLDNTVSQSSMMSKATCNICGKDYFDGCQHIAGKSYDIEDGDNTVQKTCILQCSDFYPVELSIVNCPGNDSSITYVPNYAKTSSSDSNDNEPLNDDKEPEITNKDNKDKNNKMEDSMFKDLLKDALLKNAVEAFKDEKTTELFNKVFDSLETEEQVSAFKDFLNMTIEKIKEASDVKEEENELADDKEVEEKSISKDEEELEIPEEKPEEAQDKEEKKPVADDKTQVSNLENTFATLKTKSTTDEKHLKKVNAILANL